MTASKYQWRRLIEYLIQSKVPPEMIRCILMSVDTIVRTETAELRTEVNRWVDIAMQGEALRDRILRQAIVDGAFSKLVAKD